MSDDAKLRMVEIVLHWAWDPIGMRGVEETADEYNMYASQVLGMLEANASDEQIANYLTNIVRDRMGLPAKPDRDEGVSSMLRQLYSIGR